MTDRQVDLDSTHWFNSIFALQVSITKFACLNKRVNI